MEDNPPAMDNSPPINRPLVGLNPICINCAQIFVFDEPLTCATTSLFELALYKINFPLRSVTRLRLVSTVYKRKT